LIEISFGLEIAKKPRINIQKILFFNSRGAVISHLCKQQNLHGVSIDNPYNNYSKDLLFK